MVTLLTDFGPSAPYVAALKGAILRVHPGALLIDAGHDVAPQGILEAAFLLDTYWPHFPPGTVHLAVIDPGVGTERRGVALAAAGHFFVGPDNGLFSYQAERATAIVRLANGRHARAPASPTFHGRDIFGPVAGHLARGEPLAALGPPHRQVEILPAAWPRAVGTRLVGTVLHIDRFGNVITNFRGRDAARAGAVRFRPRQRARRRVRTYGEARAREVAWLVGSSDRIEVTVPGGSAAARWKIRAGDPAILELQPSPGAATKRRPS